MEIVLILGVVLFGVSSALFYLNKPNAFNAPFLVSFITLVSYLVMLEGSFVSLSLSGQELYWTRWVFYALSCSLLMYSISKKLDFSQKQLIHQIYLTVIVMLTGALASFFQTDFKWVMFAISSVAFVMLIMPILSSTKDARDKILPYIVFGWTAFPVFFLLSPEGINAVSNSAIALVYIFLDLFTKIVFYFTSGKMEQGKEERFLTTG